MNDEKGIIQYSFADVTNGEDTKVAMSFGDSYVPAEHADEVAKRIATLFLNERLSNDESYKRCHLYQNEFGVAVAEIKKGRLNIKEIFSPLNAVVVKGLQVLIDSKDENNEEAVGAIAEAMTKVLYQSFNSSEVKTTRIDSEVI